MVTLRSVHDGTAALRQQTADAGAVVTAPGNLRHVDPFIAVARDDAARTGSCCIYSACESKPFQRLLCFPAEGRLRYAHLARGAAYFQREACAAGNIPTDKGVINCPAFE